MAPKSLRLFATCLILLAEAATATTPAAGVPGASSPESSLEVELAAEVARLQAFVATDPGTNEDGKSIREGSRPLLADAEGALAAGRPWLALSRLSLVWGNLEGSRYVETLPAASRSSLPALETAWRSFDGAPDTAGGVSSVAIPAAARAVAESARLEAEGYHEASLEYGKNTVIDAGFFYIGAAAGQLDLARFAERLPPPSSSSWRPLPARKIAVEIAALEDELLAAYRPPASIASHSVFIRASALLKEARELDAAGQHYGALHRLLDARHRLSRIVRGGGLSAEAAAARERELRQRLRLDGRDPSLLLMFVEAAALDAAPLLGSTPPPPEVKSGELARAVFDDVVPLYFAAIGPAPPEPPAVQAQATVTLVRWPYT